MAIELKHESGGKILDVHLSGTLTKRDYLNFAPQVEQLIARHGKLRLMVTLQDFHGWSPGALWEDIKFDLKHFGDFERLAIVGGKRWQKGMSRFCAPFTSAIIRYFDPAKSDDANQWIHA